KGAQLALVLIADCIEHQPLTWELCEAEAPVLPAHFMAGDREAGPLRLRDMQRLRGGPSLANGDRIQVGWLRDGQDAGVEDLDDLFLVQVDVGDHTLNGPGILVLRVSLVIAHGPCAARAVLFRQVVAPRRPAIDFHVLKVLDAAFAQSFLPAFIRADDVFRQLEILRKQRRLSTEKLFPGEDLLALEIYDGLEGPVA